MNDTMQFLEGQLETQRSLRDEYVTARDAAMTRIRELDIRINLLLEMISTAEEKVQAAEVSVRSAAKEGKTQTLDSRRGPKGAWRIVMPEMLKQYPTGIFRLVDVEAAGELTNRPLKPETVRSQMANYVTAGYLERKSQGVFRFTDKGRAIFSELSNKPSKLRLVTESLPAGDAQVDGGMGELAPPKASHA